MIISEVLDRVSVLPVVLDPGHFVLEPAGMSGKINL
jgi:hypothetical protein